jgi:hypothetical protein
VVWKVIGITGGSATKFGGQDLDKINQAFNGVADVDTVDWNSVWSFRSGKLRQRSSTTTFNLIHNVGALAADRNVNWPAITADDIPAFNDFIATFKNKSIVHGSNGNSITGLVDASINAHTSTKITITDRTHLPTLAAYLDTAQAFTAAQKFDLPLKVKPTALPSLDSSYGQLVCNSSDGNKPYFLLPSGTSYNLTSGAGAGGTPYIFDTFPATYTISTDDTVSSNGLWRTVYRGSTPGTSDGAGRTGVRAPAGGAFTRVMYEYPYTSTYTGTSTSASLILTEGPYFSDFDLTMYVRTVAQKKTTNVNPWETAWIMFRYNEAGFASSAAGSRYHQYYLTLKANGTLELGKKDNTGSFEEQYFLSTGVAYTYALGAWNKVRIKAVSNHITVWIDDVQKIDLIDDGAGGAQGGAPNTPAAPSTFLYSGKIGLYNEDAEVEFAPMTLTDLSAGSAASSTASYVTLATDSSLASERVLTAGNGVSITDAGAGNSVTVAARNRILTRLVTELDIVSSTTETDLLAYTVPASTLGTDKALRVEMCCDYLNNSAADRTLTIKIKYGATTLYNGTTGNLVAASTRRACTIDFKLYAKNSVTSQGLTGHVRISNSGGSTTGIGDINGTEDTTGTIGGVNAAENSALGKTLSVTVTHSASSANLSFRRQYAVIEVLD